MGIIELDDNRMRACLPPNQARGSIGRRNRKIGQRSISKAAKNLHTDFC